MRYGQLFRRIIILIIIGSFILSSCHSNKNVVANGSHKGFFVYLYQGKKQGNRINLLLEAKSHNQNKNFKCEEYSKFKIITPDNERAEYNQINLHSFKLSSNTIEIDKDKEFILIFLYNEIKEEFKVEIEDNKILVKPLQKSRFFDFKYKEVYLIPENSLLISFFDFNSSSKDLINEIQDLGFRPTKLHRGNYFHFILENNHPLEKYAHKRKNSDNKFIFCFPIKNNYSRIKQIFEKQKNNMQNEFDYYFNFNIDSKIELENSNNEFLTIKIPDISENNDRTKGDKNNSKIRFEINEPQTVEIQIFNSKGNLILLNSITFSVGGKYEYIWNGIDQKGKIVEKGIYFYNCKFKDGNLSPKKMIILR